MPGGGRDRLDAQNRVSRFIALLLAAAAFCFAGGGAQALDYEFYRQGRETAVLVTGEFQYGDEKRFRREIQNAKPVSEVIFASPGGNVYAALAIGRGSTADKPAPAPAFTR